MGGATAAPLAALFALMGGRTMAGRQSEGIPMYCPDCGLGQPDEHRFCVSCGRALPRDLLPFGGSKITDYFAGVQTHSTDRPDAVLRVSRYLRDMEVSTEEGIMLVPGHHARLSMWFSELSACAMSLADAEAERLARFLTARVPDPLGLAEPTFN